MNKLCSKCKIQKPIEDFYTNRTRKDGVASYCIVCANRAVKEWEEKHPDKVKLKNKNQKLKSYGLSIDDFNILLKKQNYVCPICKLKLDDTIQKLMYNKPCIDHNHETGEVRGIIHLQCNLWLEYYERFKGYLQNTEDYLGGISETSIR